MWDLEIIQATHTWSWDFVSGDVCKTTVLSANWMLTQARWNKFIQLAKAHSTVSRATPLSFNCLITYSDRNAGGIGKFQERWCAHIIATQLLRIWYRWIQRVDYGSLHITGEVNQVWELLNRQKIFIALADIEFIKFKHHSKSNCKWHI